MDKEEILDLVDKDDNVIGREKRSVIHANHWRNYRVVNAFIRNSRGELWIPRRPAHKRIAPLSLDFSMGGHVESGETYEATFKRETMEELNLDTTTVPCKLIGSFKGGEHDLQAFMHVYEMNMDTVPNYNPHDFIEYYWMKPCELTFESEHPYLRYGIHTREIAGQ